MKLALLTTDNREPYRQYGKETPWFGTAPTALLEGFAQEPSLEVHVISCTQQPMTSPAKLAENIYFHSLHVPKLGWLRTFYQGCVRATRRKLREIGPDIVHGQGTERECSISAVLSGFPNVLTIHGNMAALAREFHARPGSYHWLTGKLENFTLPRTQGVLCNSKYTESLVRPRNPRVWSVPNAVRASFFSPPPNRRGSAPVRLLNVGAITPRKRQVELLQMFRKLHEQGCAFQVEFLGGAKAGDPYAEQFLEMLRQPGVSDYVSYSGFKEDEKALIEFFDGADGCVHFPSEEAFGLVVAEALARNLKMLGARVGGMVEIMSGVEGAELFAMDDWTGLEKALVRWIGEGSLCPVTAAQTMSERYHPVVIARRHVEIYEEVLSHN